jgi:hypothetical protein
MKTTQNLKKETKDSKMTRAYSTSQKKKKHRKPKKGITAPYGVFGTQEKYYSF